MTSFESPARFLTITEAAAALRVSTATVYRLVTSGELPARRVDASYLIRADHVAPRGMNPTIDLTGAAARPAPATA